MLEIFSDPAVAFFSMWISIVWLTALTAIIFAYYPIKRILTNEKYGEIIKHIEKSWICAMLVSTGLLFFYGIRINFYYSFIWLAPWFVSIFYIFKATRTFEEICALADENKEKTERKTSKTKRL